MAEIMTELSYNIQYCQNVFQCIINNNIDLGANANKMMKRCKRVKQNMSFVYITSI